jgi:hypothetical protein
MRAKALLTFPTLAAVLTLTSCSGLHSVTPCTNCPPTGNASLSLTIYDAPPTGVTLLSFTLPIVGISLTPSSGSQVSVFSPTSSANFEMTRLQSDSSLITTGASVAAGTYTAINVTVGASSGIFINQSSATVGSCPAGTVCALPNGAATTITYTFASPLVLTSGQKQWIGLHFNLNNAISTAGGISINFGNTGVLTATTTPRTGLPTGAVDTIEDFVGVVTAYTSGSSITVASGISGQSLTAVLNSNTEYDQAGTSYSQCTLASTCITVGSTVSLDTALASSGTLTATEVDVLDAKAVNEVEGIVYPTSTAGLYGMILSDKVVTDGNTALTAATYGSGVFLTATPTVVYFVDTKTLSIPIPNPATLGFPGTGLVAGQVVRAQLTAATTGTTGINATASNVILRYSRVSGTISTLGTFFNIANLPPYINALNTSLSLTPQVGTYLNYTAFDGVVNTTDTNFVIGANVAIRALYLSSTTPSFQAAKVRVP